MTAAQPKLRINPRCRLRNVSGEDLLLLRDRDHADMTTIVAFSPTARYLWDSLGGMAFDLSDAVRLLTEEYEVDEAAAAADAAAWIDILRENGALIEEER